MPGDQQILIDSKHSHWHHSMLKVTLFTFLLHSAVCFKQQLYHIVPFSCCHLTDWWAAKLTAAIRQILSVNCFSFFWCVASSDKVRLCWCFYQKITASVSGLNGHAIWPSGVDSWATLDPGAPSLLLLVQINTSCCTLAISQDSCITWLYIPVTYS